MNSFRFSFIILALAAASSGALFLYFPPSGSPSPSFAAYADQVFSACQNSQYRPGCYDEEIPKLMDAITMEEAFEVTRMIQGRDPAYQFCHVLGHNLSAREAAKDPAKWKDVILRCPSGVCSNGCLHGAFQERYRTETLSPEEIPQLISDIEDVCESREERPLTGLEQASCYHAVGHLLMYVTGADLPRANAICREVAVKPDGRNFLQTCYEGNFMQVFQPLEAEDFDLVRGLAPETPTAARELCSTFGEEAFHACMRESWPLARETILASGGVLEFCGYSEDPGARKRCYNALFYIIPVQVNFDAERIAALCRELPDAVRAQCFANSASRFIETDYGYADRSVRLCEEAKTYGADNQCYEELLFYSTFNYLPGSDAFRSFCGSMPEPWRTRCLEKP